MERNSKVWLFLRRFLWKQTLNKLSKCRKKSNNKKKYKLKKIMMKGGKKASLLQDQGVQL